MSNFDVSLKFDENGQVSTNPTDVLKLGQQMLIKALLKVTDDGKNPANDIKELNMLVSNMNNTALMTRKLDQEAEAILDQKALVENFKHFERLARGKNLYGEPSKDRKDPYLELELDIETEINPGELEQGEISLSADDFIPKD